MADVPGVNVQTLTCVLHIDVKTSFERFIRSVSPDSALLQGCCIVHELW